MLFKVVSGWSRDVVLGSVLSGFLLLAPFSALAVRSVTLAWDPSSDPNIASYNVYYGVASRVYTNTIPAGTSTNATIPGLIEGTTYYFAATCVDKLGLESDFSTEVYYTVPTPNQAPTLNALPNLTINEGSPLQTVSLSGISSGATNEAQTLSVTASSSNTGLIPTPTVSYASPSATGSISFTPVPFAYGSATVTVTVNDGAATNNVVSRSFTVTVNSVNQAPTLNPLVDVTVNEGAGPQTVSLSGITSGATNEAQMLTVTTSSSNTGLIPTPTVIYTSPNTTGSISFTPAPYANGSATVTVTVNDGGASNNVVTRSFNVTVNSVNQAPTLNALTDLTINESSGLQTVNLSGIGTGASNEVQTLTVTSSSSNTGLVPTPTVNYTSPNAAGSITFTPVPYAYGSATVTITVNDGGASNNVVTRSFNVTVNSVNQAPTLNALTDTTINENAGQQTISLSGISSGASNETQTLAVTASSSNTGLIPAPTVSYTSPNATGSLSFTPAPYANGSATVTVTVNDGGGSNNVVSRSFRVTVNSVNQAPTLNALANMTINQNAGLQTVNLSGITTGATNEVQILTVTSSSSNTGLIPTPTVNYTSPNASGSISFTPARNASGVATLTITVNDGATTDNVVSRSFTVTVNELPTISGISNVLAAVDSPIPGLAFTVGDAETPLASLAVTGASSNQALVKSTDLVFAGTGADRVLTITPQPGITGEAEITVTVSDGNATATSTFLLTIGARPSPPMNLHLSLGP